MIRTKRKAAKKRHVLSDRYLDMLFRQAVLSYHKNICIICGRPRSEDLLEAHHIAHKKTYKFLRWDRRNGVPVCKDDTAWDGKFTCHQFADSLAGEKLIRERIGADWLYIEAMQMVTKKQYLTEQGMTDDEFRTMQADALKEMIG
jgi:hypothetical protein